MRTIKFRGKNIETGEWVYGFYTQGGYIREDGTTKVRHIIHSDVLYDVKENTIGQYTGLQDKNGVEIYEGDIIGNKKIGYGYEIFYDKEIASFRMRGSEEFKNFRINEHWIKEYKREVIGNIHDNPELLKGE